MANAAGASVATTSASSSGDPQILLLQLPTELVVRILEHLPQADLWRVAFVSRSLYEAAWRSGLYIHWKMTLDHYTGNIDQQLNRLNELIDYVLARSLRLWLSISMYLNTDADNSWHSLAPSVFSAITRSLPRVVGLCLRCRAQFLPDVYSALSDPAPLLRVLKIYPHLIPEPCSPPFPPPDIFATVAPQLRTLGLRDHMIGPRLVPAFTHIRTLFLEGLEGTTCAPFGQYLPRLSSLHMDVSSNERKLPRVDLSGLELHTLVMRGIRPWERLSSLRNLRLDDLAEVHLVGPYAIWGGPLWERDIGDHAVHLRVSDRIRGWQVSVIPQNRRWRFVYHVVQTLELCGMDRMPLAAQHLTSLRMDNMGIHGFLKSTDVALLALREICIDLHSASRAPCLIWPPDYPHLFPEESMQVQHRSGPTFDGVSDSFYYYMRCPALEKVAVFALDAPVTVHAPEVAFLGRSLSLLDRAEANKPTLALVGVDFAEWTDSHAVLLGRVLSTITKLDFAGASFDDYDHVHGDHVSF